MVIIIVQIKYKIKQIIIKIKDKKNKKNQMIN